MKVVVLAAHTDDAEVGVGGTMVNLAMAGHQVVMVNMTGGKGPSRRTGKKAARMIGAEAEWLDFEDLKIDDGDASYAKLESCLKRLRPDVIIGHWPVDEHRDHRAVGSLAVRFVTACDQGFILKSGIPRPKGYCPYLLFYEVIIGKQTKCFRPDRYVDLTEDVHEKKRRLMLLYAGNPPKGYGKSWFDHHEIMLAFRARESGASSHTEIDAGIWAEAFVTFPIPRGRKALVLPGQR